MMKKIIQMLFIPTMLISLIMGLLFNAQAGTKEYTLGINHLERTFLVHVPKSARSEKDIPLVIALHGGGSDGKSMEKISGLSEASDRYGFIVVYPDGSGKFNKVLTWNSGKCCGYANKLEINDVGFITELIGYMIKQYSADPSRVYVTGMSNGAMMAYRLAAEIPDKIAAICAVSGTLDINQALVQEPVPILHFHGTEDQYVPFEGGRGARTIDKSSHRSVMDTIKIWMNVNETNSIPLEEELPDRYEDGTRIVRYIYNPMHNDADIVLYKIIGGGHTWPGRPHLKLLLGTTTLEISANDIMWKFFSAHIRKSHPRAKKWK